jgi:hypothetical protein
LAVLEGRNLMRLDRTVQPYLDSQLQNSAITSLKTHLGDSTSANSVVLKQTFVPICWRAWNPRSASVYLTGIPPMLGASAFPENHSVFICCGLLEVASHSLSPQVLY